MWCGVMYGWQLESILSRFAARFDHTNHSLAICALPEPTPPLRLMYDFGLIFVEHVRRKCTGVRVCLCLCVCVARSRFAVIDTRLRHAPRTSAQGRRLRKMQKKKKGKGDKNKTKNQIEFSLDREWATPDYALLKTINRFDIEREQRGDRKIQRYIALHSAAECNVAK